MSRLEDGPLLSSVTFLAGLRFEDALDVAFVRSQTASGLVRSVEAPPGVDLVTAADLTKLPPLVASVLGVEFHADVPIPYLAADRVAYVGQPVAAVLAADRYAAEDGASAVVVDVEERPAVTSAEADRSGPLPHLAGVQEDDVLGSVQGGDWDAVGEVLDAAPVRLERTFRHGRGAALPLETRGVVAQPRPDGGLVVWSTTQMPGLLRNILAEVLGVEPGRIEVRVPPIGGAFGVKAYVYPEEVLVAHLALTRGRTVRWIEDRAEHLLSGTQAREATLTLEIGAEADGRIRALRCRATSDAGAYPCFPWGATCELKWLPFLPGPYQVGSFAYRGAAIATNKVPLGIYRGVAQPFLTFVMERAMDMLAHRCGVSREAVRDRNLVDGDFVSAGGFPHEACSYRESLAMAGEEVRQARVRLAPQLRPGETLGTGYALFSEATGGPSSSRFPPRGLPAHEDVVLRLSPEGRVEILCGLLPHGQSTHTTFAGIIRDEIGLSPQAVDWVNDLTEADGAGTWGSRSVVAFDGPLRELARAFLVELAGAAAEVTGVAPDALRLDGDRLCTDDGEVALALDELARKVAPVQARTRFRPDRLVFSNACHVAHVAVDEEADTVRVLELVVIEDCGRHLEPALVRGQVIGGVVQGIGEALYEDIVYDESGQPLTTTLMDFSIPTVFECPTVRVIDVPGSEHRPPKGVGEGGVIGVPAAIGNAIADATARGPRPIDPTAVPMRELYPIGGFS